jgi:ligand-binding sensor domain-containing protein
MMKKMVRLLLMFVILMTSMACYFGAQPKAGPAPTAVETDACCLSIPEDQETPTATTAVEPPVSPVPTSSPPPASELVPGKYAYTNANVVRDLAVYKGVVHAATLGGLVTWRLDSGYSMQYTPLNGMGHVSATSITYCEIPEARILVGTLAGITIYDPNTGLWEKKSLAPADSRVDVSKIERLYCDQANNRLLIGYYGLGVLDLKTKAFQRFNKNEGLLWESVTDLTVNGKDIWIASGYKGIAQISDGKVTTYSAENGIPDEHASSLAFAKDGTLWVGASSGIMSFKGGKWTLFGSDSPAKLSSINQIEIGADGKLWAATAPLGIGRLCQFNPNTASCDVDYQEMDKQPILALTLAENGAPIYGTGKGVYVFENDKAKPFKTGDQLASNYVDSFATAPDGKLWVGTDNGVQVLDPAKPADRWKTFRQSEMAGMGGNWASGIAFAPNGTAWIATINGSASRYQDGSWTALKNIYSYNAVTVDAQGRAWFGDDGKGIIVLNPDGSQAMQLTTAEGLPGDNVQALVTDLSGRVWIGTDQGLAKYENNTLEVVFGKDNTQLPNKYIRALALDGSGALIIGTFTGAARYDYNQVEVLVDFIKAGFSEARLTTLAVAPNQRIWVGTDKGLLYSDNWADWTMLTTQDALLTNYISALHVDQYGAAWIGGGGSNFDGGGLLQVVP